MNIKLINLLIAAALTLAGFAYSEEAQANTATVSPALSSDELPTKYELYEQFLDSNGGRSNLSDIVSLIIHGTIKQDETELDFKIFRKRPDKLRIQINRNGFQINTIYDGRSAWIELVNQSDEIDIIELDEDEYWTEDDLDGMNKEELEELGREYGIELDRRKTKSVLIAELKEVMFE